MTAIACRRCGAENWIVLYEGYCNQCRNHTLANLPQNKPPKVRRNDGTVMDGTTAG